MSTMEKIFGDPKLKKIYRIIFFIALVFFVVIDAYMYFSHGRHHPHNYWLDLPGVNAAFGIIGASAIIVFAKLLYGKFVYRKEGYYNE
ncbi:MAG: hypothetical protein V3T30_04500 [Thermodesulfobacteriota bacterium]